MIINEVAMRAASARGDGQMGEEKKECLLNFVAVRNYLFKNKQL